MSKRDLPTETYMGKGKQTLKHARRVYPRYHWKFSNAAYRYKVSIVLRGGIKAISFHVHNCCVACNRNAVKVACDAFRTMRAYDNKDMHWKVRREYFDFYTDDGYDERFQMFWARDNLPD